MLVEGYVFLMRAFSGRFENTVQSVVQAREAITMFAQNCGFCSFDVFDITLAAGEACTNAVEHGHVTGGHFTIECAAEDDWLKVTIHDTGKTGTCERVLPEKHRVGGLGIFLIRELTDELTFDVDSEGATITFLKRKSESKAA